MKKMIAVLVLVLAAAIAPAATKPKLLGVVTGEVSGDPKRNSLGGSAPSGCYNTMLALYLELDGTYSLSLSVQVKPRPRDGGYVCQGSTTDKIASFTLSGQTLEGTTRDTSWQNAYGTELPTGWTYGDDPAITLLDGADTLTGDFTTTEDDAYMVKIKVKDLKKAKAGKPE